MTSTPPRRVDQSYGSSSETDFGPSGADFNKCGTCGHERWLHHQPGLCEGGTDRYTKIENWCKCPSYRGLFFRLIDWIREGGKR